MTPRWFPTYDGWMITHEPNVVDANRLAYSVYNLGMTVAMERQWSGRFDGWVYLIRVRARPEITPPQRRARR